MFKLLVVTFTALLIVSCSQNQILDDPDGKVVFELAKAGSDLDKEHLIEFFIYFNEQEVAESAVVDLEKDGFETELDISASSDEWLLLAKKSMPLSVYELQKIRKRFDALTSDGKGVYDGWGTSVVQ